MKVIISSHTHAYGPSQAIKDFLDSRLTIRPVFIEHKLSNRISDWIWCVIVNFVKTIKQGQLIDLYIGCNNLNAFSGILLKKLGVVKSVVYYSQEYSPNRFTNRLINSIYKNLDIYCVKQSDFVWNCCVEESPGFDAMISARLALGLSRKYIQKQLQVPDGTIHGVCSGGGIFEKFRIGFVGHLRFGMGVHYLIDAFELLKNEFPNASLIVIGDGPMESELRSKANKIGGIEMMGYIGDIHQVMDILASCHLNVAPYEINEMTPYSDSGKVKIYISASRPLVVTKVPSIHRLITESECGLAVDPNSAEVLYRAIKSIFESNYLADKMAVNSKKLCKMLSWDSIYESAFKSMSIKISHE